MLLILFVIAAVLVSSGFFSGAEAALISLTQPEVETMVQKHRLGSAALARVHRVVDRAVMAIVILNNSVNIVGSIIVGQLVVERYGSAFLGVATTALTFGVIVFSEIIPKSLGIHYAHAYGLLVAPIIWVLMTMLYPLIALLVWLTNIFKSGERKVGTEEQIRSLVSIGRREGHIETDEGQLIHRAFILNDKTAGDAMTPLKDLIYIRDYKTVSQAWEKMQDHPFSRFPVVSESIHEVKGTLHKQDVLLALMEGRGDQPVPRLMRPSLVVNYDMQLDDLLFHFRDQSIHLAVVHQGDKTTGLVTLEDVIEELVGEIEDETDTEHEQD